MFSWHCSKILCREACVSINGEQSSVSFYVPTGSAGLENSYLRGIACSAFLFHAGEFRTASSSVDSSFFACSESTKIMYVFRN